ncbi:reverse transcriptase domain-containing protein [Tanacetum coccineum]
MGNRLGAAVDAYTKAITLCLKDIALLFVLNHALYDSSDDLRKYKLTRVLNLRTAYCAMGKRLSQFPCDSGCPVEIIDSYGRVVEIQDTLNAENGLDRHLRSFTSLERVIRVPILSTNRHYRDSRKELRPNTTNSWTAKPDKGHAPDISKTHVEARKVRSPRHEYKSKGKKRAPVFRDSGGRGRVRPHTPIASGKALRSGRSPEKLQAAQKRRGEHANMVSHFLISTLTGNARVWFDDLPPESIDSYNDLREAFLKNYLQQKKCIRDPIVLHNIKQRDGETTEDFIQRYKSCKEEMLKEHRSDENPSGFRARKQQS